MELIREILAGHRSGISRDGLLAWARLRGNPQMTDAELDATLVAMGDEVVDVQGFLYLRANAPPGAAARVAPRTSTVLAPEASAGPAPEAAPPPSIPAWEAPAEATPGDLNEPSWIPTDEPSWIPPDPQAGGRRTRVIAAVAVGVFVAISLAAALVLRAEEGGASSGPEATAVAPTPTAGTVIGAGDLSVGDCIVVPAEDEFDEVRRLSCTEPHDGEVFFVGDHPDGAFPPNEEFAAFVDVQCRPAFAAFTGSDYDEQEVLEVGWFTPTAGAWERGDREIVCHLTPADGSRTDRSWQGSNP